MGGRLVSVPRCTLVDALEVPKGTSFADGDSDLDFQVDPQFLWSRDLRPREEVSLVPDRQSGPRSQLRIARQVGSETQP